MSADTATLIRHDFNVGDKVVYPAHGVGTVAAVETQEVAGYALEVYVVTFDHEKMTLRVPTKKAKTAAQRRQWVEVANGELAKHGDESRAIRAANAVIADPKRRARKKK